MSALDCRSRPESIWVFFSDSVIIAISVSMEVITLDLYWDSKASFSWSCLSISGVRGDNSSLSFWGVDMIREDICRREISASYCETSDLRERIVFSCKSIWFFIVRFSLISSKFLSWIFAKFAAFELAVFSVSTSWEIFRVTAVSGSGKQDRSLQ